MEFGTLIPLVYITLCCLVATPLAGLGALAFIYFPLHDKALARNVLVTVIATCLAWFMFPLVQLAVAAVLICRECPESSFRITREVLSTTLGYGARLSLLPGTATGFILAFLLMVPTTLLIRSIRGRSASRPTPLPPEHGPQA